MTDYKKHSDEELLALLRQNPAEESRIEEYLLDKYKPLARKLTSNYYLIGGDSDDLIQEAMIGLFKAIRDFDPTKESSFLNFAYLCIQRQIKTAVDASLRKKHQPLNSYVSMSAGSEDEETGLEALLSGMGSENPEDQVIDQEFWEEFYRNLWKELSKMEQEVLSLYREGKTYTEIAAILNKEPKAIDNALQRIRKKVSKWNFQESIRTPSAVSSQRKKSRT